MSTRAALAEAWLNLELVGGEGCVRLGCWAASLDLPIARRKWALDTTIHSERREEQKETDLRPGTELPS